MRRVKKYKKNEHKSDYNRCRGRWEHFHIHTQCTEDISVQQTAEPVTECNGEMIIRTSGWWMDCELAMSRPSSLILCDGFFFLKDTNTDKKVTGWKHK